MYPCLYLIILIITSNFFVVIYCVADFPFILTTFNNATVRKRRNLVRSACTVYDHNFECRSVDDPINPCDGYDGCGPNSACGYYSTGIKCLCLKRFTGKPPNCRPECNNNKDCAGKEACVKQRCLDPCAEGPCGLQAECKVLNHVPVCSCIPRHVGNPFVKCIGTDEKPSLKNPCNPSPCGPNSICADVQQVTTCTCIKGFIGSPPKCRAECDHNGHCDLEKTCVNQRCIDACEGTCGIDARCQVLNHIPVCSCPWSYTGDPFVKCEKLSQNITAIDLCTPSPCGPNSDCSIINGYGVCKCLPWYVGSPPHCKQECVKNSDCPSNYTCLNQVCQNVCMRGVCGIDAECKILYHVPICSCKKDYTGDPFFACNPIKKDENLVNVCEPNPCGKNSECHVVNGQAVCSCLPNFTGHPPLCVETENK